MRDGCREFPGILPCLLPTVRYLVWRLAWLGQTMPNGTVVLGDLHSAAYLALKSAILIHLVCKYQLPRSRLHAPIPFISLSFKQAT